MISQFDYYANEKKANSCKRSKPKEKPLNDDAAIYCNNRNEKFPSN